MILLPGTTNGEKLIKIHIQEHFDITIQYMIRVPGSMNCEKHLSL